MLPEEKKLIEQMVRAYNGLRAYGWRDIREAPRDGTEFLVLNPGSTGVFVASWAKYDGVDVGWVISDGVDLYAATPLLFRSE